MKTPPKPTFRKKLWASLEPTVLILLCDIILFLIVLAALVVGYAGVAALKAFGMPRERLELLEIAHSYTYLGAAGLFLLDMLAKIVLEIFRGSPHG